MWDFVMDKSGAGAGFLRELRFPPRTSVSPANLHFICSTIIFTITRGWHNRPGVAAVPITWQSRIKKNKLIKYHRFRWLIAVNIKTCRLTQTLTSFVHLPFSHPSSPNIHLTVILPVSTWLSKWTLSKDLTTEGLSAVQFYHSHRRLQSMWPL
jgi:hypothetical protein